MENPSAPDLNSIATNASFVINAGLAVWIDQEAKRRGVSKSVLVREILEAARAESEAPVEQEVMAS